MHKLGTFNQKAVDIGALIKQHNQITSPPSRSEIKWHQSYQYVAIGNEDGTIDVFDAPHLTLLGQIQAHKKIINTIDWHHDFTADLSGKISFESITLFISSFNFTSSFLLKMGALIL